MTWLLPLHEYLQLVDASNFKQRKCMSMLYFHAGLCNYAVIGTFIKNEHAQGFLVKYGDTRVFLPLTFRDDGFTLVCTGTEHTNYRDFKGTGFNAGSSAASFHGLHTQAAYH